MKKIIVCFLVMCLLFTSGCCLVMDRPAEKVLVPIGTRPTQMPAQPSVPEATQGPAEFETEPVMEQPETVTVYLLEKLFMVDSGYLEYSYTEDYNLKQATHWGMEGDQWYTTYYEDYDANGMPCTIRTVWDADMIYTTNLTYDANGRLESEEDADSAYSGYQYAYDERGNMVEKRQYYDGILENTIYCRYEGDQLVEAYGESMQIGRNMEAKLENGRIVETQHLSTEDAYSYRYTYDENGNLHQTFFSLYYGEETLQATYSYIAVEMDYERAQAILQQQAYILSVL